MPSPVGHGLAGLAIALAIEPGSPGKPFQPIPWFSRFAVVSAVVAALPDADLLYPPIHRGISHSIGMTVILMIIAAGVTGWVTGKVQWRWVVLVGLAHASHIIMDWLGADRYDPQGLQALWPFSHQFYISGLDIFPPTERRVYLTGALLINLRAFLAEVAFTLPIVALLFAARRTRRSRVPTSVPGSLRRPSA